MKNKIITTLTILAFGLTLTTSSLAHEGEEDTSPIPVTLGATWQAILKKQAELQGASASQSLPTIHKLAYRLRDLCNTLPEKSRDLAPEKAARLAGAVKNIAKLAEDLDRTGDTKDLAGTQANLKKLNGLIHLAARQYEQNRLVDVSKEPAPDEAALKGKEHAHSDHESKRGGVLMMLGDYHIEGVQVEDTFRVYFFNEYTRPIPAVKITGKLVLPLPPGAKPDDAEPTLPLQLSEDGLYLFAKRPANYPDDYLTVRLLIENKETPFGFPIYKTTEATCAGCKTKTIAGLQAVSACGMCAGKLSGQGKKVACNKCPGEVSLNSPETLAVSYRPPQVVDISTGDNAPPMQQLLGKYYQVQASLASDDLKSAQAKAGMLGQLAGKLAEGRESNFAKVAQAAQSLATANDLAQARKAFGAISAAAIAELGGIPSLGQKYYIIHCPMAKVGNGDWVQPSMQIANPYFGSKMLTCGAVKTEGK